MMRTVVGLDIGTTAVRAVETRGPSRSARIRRSGQVALTPGAVEGGQIQRPDEVTQAVRRLWHEQRFSTKAVRLGVGSGAVLVRQVELDWMPDQDLRKALRFLVADLLPVPVDEANIDHVVLGEVTHPDPTGGPPRRMAKILLVATAREGVDQFVRCVQAAGLRPTTADLSPFALIRAATALAPGQHGADPAPTEAIIDVGADKTSVAVHRSGAPHFVRVMPGLGGASLTRQVSEATGLTWDEAERLKLLGGSDLPTEAIHALPLATQILAAASTRLAEEVRETLAFHATSHPTEPVHRLVLTGLGAKLQGFGDHLAHATGLPVTHLERVTGRSRPGRTAADTGDVDLTVSYGLCLGAA